MSRIGKKGRFDPASYQTRHPHVKEELRNIISDLPILEDRRIHIDFCLDSLLQVTVLARVKESPGYRDSTACEIRHSLTLFANRAKRLIECIDTLPAEAAREIFPYPCNLSEALLAHMRPSPPPIIEQPSPPQIACRDDLLRRARHASLAKERLAAAVTRKSARKLTQAVTRLAAEAYKVLTDRRPYRGRSLGKGSEIKPSPFERFLSKVFAILEIDANAEAQARLLPDKSHAK